MPNQTFAFKQFTIKQDKCAMKVGTDAVLLGSWVDAADAEHVLDIGTGTGVLSLMIAQKSNALIDAIDIEESSCQEANENARNSKWADRINIHHIAFQDFSRSSSKKYDLIVTNPPYFVDSSKASEEARTMARHADLLPFHELIAGVLKIIKPKGKFHLILPSKEGELFRDMAEEKRLYLNKLIRIKTTVEKPEKRLMMQFGLSREHFSETCIAIETGKRHSYTKEYKELTRDYYLGF